MPRLTKRLAIGTGLWLSFARNPSKDPSQDGFTWPKYDSKANTLVQLAEDGVAATLVARQVVDNECSV